MLMLCFCQIITAQGDQFERGKAILWRRSDYPTTMGYATFKSDILLTSPCELLPTKRTNLNVSVVLLKGCEEQYKTYFMDELHKVCPYKGEAETTTTQKENRSLFRPKRFVFTALVVTFIVAIAVPGITIGSIALHKSYAAAAQAEMVETEIKQLEEQLCTNSDRIELLKQEVEKIIQEMQERHRVQITLGYLISEVTNRLMKGEEVIYKANKAWKKGEMEEGFFRYISFEHPTAHQYSIPHGMFHKCELNRKTRQFTMEYSLPIVNADLQIVEADPFQLLIKRNGETCTYKYIGPELAVISKKDDCLYSIQMEKAPVGKLPLASSLNCKPQLSFKKDDKLFEVINCKKEEEGDYKRFSSVKVYNNLYYIYCPNSTIAMANREVKCPNYIFTLPLSASFTLNNIEYTGEILSVIYHQKEDPLFIEKLKWHLHDHIDWNKEELQFETNWNKTTRQHVEKYMFNEYSTFIIAIGALFGITIFILAIIGTSKKINRLCPKKQNSKRKEQPPIEMEERPTTSSTVFIR